MENDSTMKPTALAVALTAALAVTAPLHAQQQEGEQELSQSRMISYYEGIAMSGEPYAQFTVGEILFNGDGVRKDPLRAYAWFHVSLEQGVEESRQFMEKLEQSMTPEELAEAKDLGRQFAEVYIPKGD